MRTVWKYPLAHQKNELDLPLGAQVLHVASQKGGPLCCLWAEIAESETTELVRRTFWIAGTGSDIPMLPLRYVGTAHSPGGEFVWHVYEILA